MDILTKYREDMRGLNTLKIVDHYLISDKLTVTQYENGTKVYVNYSAEAIEAEGVTVPARSYFVKG